MAVVECKIPFSLLPSSEVAAPTEWAAVMGLVWGTGKVPGNEHQGRSRGENGRQNCVGNEAPKPLGLLHWSNKFHLKNINSRAPG